MNICDLQLNQVYFLSGIWSIMHEAVNTDGSIRLCKDRNYLGKIDSISCLDLFLLVEKSRVDSKMWNVKILGVDREFLGWIKVFNEDEFKEVLP